MSRVRLIAVSGLVFMLFTSAACADDSEAAVKLRIGKGNPEAGKAKSAMCQGCHGEDGNSASGTFPKLAGQYAAYIQKQIRDFKAGLRRDPVMSDMAATVTDEQDLLDISAYFASQKHMKGDSAVHSESGQGRFTTGNGCSNCHGATGKGAGPGNPDAPVIGGQHRDYLIKQLKDFASGARNNEANGMMPMIAASLSDEEIEDIANYVSGM